MPPKAKKTTASRKPTSDPLSQAMAGGQVEPPTQEADSRIEEITVTIPVAPFRGTEQRRHIDIDLRSSNATIVRRITEALDRGQARLSNGQRVSNNNAAIRWILEQIESAAPVEKLSTSP